jgi:hypothetical protein
MDFFNPAAHEHLIASGYSYAHRYDYGRMDALVAFLITARDPYSSVPDGLPAWDIYISNEDVVWINELKQALFSLRDPETNAWLKKIIMERELRGREIEQVERAAAMHGGSSIPSCLGGASLVGAIMHALGDYFRMNNAMGWGLFPPRKSRTLDDRS